MLQLGQHTALDQYFDQGSVTPLSNFKKLFTVKQVFCKQTFCALLQQKKVYFTNIGEDFRTHVYVHVHSGFDLSCHSSAYKNSQQVSVPLALHVVSTAIFPE